MGTTLSGDGGGRMILADDTGENISISFLPYTYSRW